MEQKKLITIILLSLIFVNISAQRLKGSDTLLPLVQKEAEVYMNKKPQAVVTVTGGGTGVGITSLLNNTTDIALASRKIKFSEKQKLVNANQTPEEVIVAYDALVVIVNPNNPVKQLTREQLEGMFRGKITNWKEVGGADLKIIPYARETSSGTYEFFRESVLKNKNYMSGIMSMPATGAIVQSVMQTPGAIGYIGFAYLNDKLKPLAVSYDQGTSYAAPTAENAESRFYPIVRPLYFYCIEDKDPKTQQVIDFILSTEGQDIVSQQGFIKVNSKK